MTIHWREKRFKGIDGSNLYYRTTGEGDLPWAILTDGIGCDGYMWRYIIPQLIDNGYQILHWHYPGHGYSEPAASPDDLSIKVFAAHLVKLCREIRMKDPLVIGHSMGVQVNLQAIHDGLDARGLAIIFGAAGRVLDQYGGNDRLGRYLPLLRTLLARQKNLIELVWKHLMPTRFGLALGLMTELNAMRMRPADFMPYLERLSVMDPEVFLAVLADAAEHDARPWLMDIDIPTLILAGGSDSFTPPRLSHAMHKMLPNSRLNIIDDASHAGPLEFPDECALAIQDYLDQLSRVARKNRR